MGMGLMADVLDCEELTAPRQTAILVWLADYADDDSGSCWPSIPQLAQKTRYSEQTVMRVIRCLERDGWLTVIRSIEEAVSSEFVLNVLRLKGGSIRKARPST